MGPGEVLRDAFDRIHEVVHEVVAGLSPEELAWRADAEANSIGWLVWHLTRVQDDHVAKAAGTQQEWVEGGWEKRFGLDLDIWDIGYGHETEQVALVGGDAELLAGYHDAVFQRTSEYVKSLSAEALDSIVDKRFDPPVTLGVRLVSVVSDDLQHAGQAAFLRGLVERARSGAQGS